MELLEAIRTTRAMRRLDPFKEVPEADISTMIEAAACAPSGGDRQPLRWIVVRDRTLRTTLGEAYRRVSARIDGPDGGRRGSRLERSIAHLAEHLGEAPVLLVAVAEGDPDLRLAASVYPAVQNLMLAARSLGLGTTLTMRHRLAEPEVRVLLNIPATVHVFAVIPVGYPLGRWAHRRDRAEPVVYRDRYGAERVIPQEGASGPASAPDSNS